MEAKELNVGFYESSFIGGSEYLLRFNYPVPEDKDPLDYHPTTAKGIIEKIARGVHIGRGPRPTWSE